MGEGKRCPCSRGPAEWRQALLGVWGRGSWVLQEPPSSWPPSSPFPPPTSLLVICAAAFFEPGPDNEFKPFP